MKEITDHCDGGMNDKLAIYPIGEAGAGGAHLAYTIADRTNLKKVVCDSLGNPTEVWTSAANDSSLIRFQSGNPADGINGVTNEALLAVVIDRLRGFQGGQFACRENAVALTKLEECLMWLQKRTRERIARGVAGTQQA